MVGFLSLGSREDFESGIAILTSFVFSPVQSALIPSVSLLIPCAQNTCHSSSFFLSFFLFLSLFGSSYSVQFSGYFLSLYSSSVPF